MTLPSHQRPLWLGVLLAPPLAHAFVLFVIAVGHAIFEGLKDTGDFALAIGIVLFFGLAISYAMTCAIGLPLILLLRRNGRLTAARLCTGAALIGAVPLTAIAAAEGASWSQSLIYVAIGAGFGVITAVCFCLAAGIAMRPRAPASI